MCAHILLLSTAARVAGGRYRVASPRERIMPRCSAPRAEEALASSGPPHISQLCRAVLGHWTLRLLSKLVFYRERAKENSAPSC